MKKILLFLLLLNTITVFAQIEKGKWIGGITLSGYADREKIGGSNSIKDNEFGSTVEISKFLSQKNFFGVGFSFNSIKKLLIEQPSSTTLNKTYRQVKFGFLLKTGVYKKLADNFFYSGSLSFKFSTFKEYNQTVFTNGGSSESTDKGYILTPQLNIVDLNYCFRERYIIKVSLANISYSYTDAKAFSDLANKNVYQSFLYSLNPLQNGITFIYIIK